MITFKWSDLTVVVVIEEIVPALSLSEVIFEFLGCSRSIFCPLLGFPSTSSLLGDSLVSRNFSTGFSVVSQYFWSCGLQVFMRMFGWRIPNFNSLVPFHRAFRLTQPSNQFWHRRQRRIGRIGNGRVRDGWRLC
jgi:hypothetical protein